MHEGLPSELKNICPLRIISKGVVSEVENFRILALSRVTSYIRLQKVLLCLVASHLFP